MSAFGVTISAFVEASPVMDTEVPALLEAGEQELALIVVLVETVNVTSCTQLRTLIAPLELLMPVEVAVPVLTAPKALVVAAGRSPAAMAAKFPTPATPVACRTWVVVVSLFAPTMYSVVIGKVSVTAPDGTPKLAVVRFVDVPNTS
jgi:hypothetical protein